jgi:hypothetical protein
MNSHDLTYENSLPSGDLVRLKEAATRFRLAIERCDPQHLAIAMPDFPKGSRSAAAPLLGTYLAEQGLGRKPDEAARRGQASRCPAAVPDSTRANQGG